MSGHCHCTVRLLKNYLPLHASSRRWILHASCYLHCHIAFAYHVLHLPMWGKEFLGWGEGSRLWGRARSADEIVCTAGGVPLLLLGDHQQHLRRALQPGRAPPALARLHDGEAVGPQHGEQACRQLPRARAPPRKGARGRACSALHPGPGALLQCSSSNIAVSRSHLVAVPVCEHSASAWPLNVLQ